jgi:integrative and conjugative element protein (TIGR02256 family)
MTDPVIAKSAVMDDWIINIQGFGRVRFAHMLLEHLCSFRQTGEMLPESGGALIGKHLIRGGRMVIDRFTPSQSDDRQGRCLFYRSKAHEKIVQRIWNESNRISTYVGLWHTHPEDYPHYSPTDKKDWFKALNKSVYDGRNLFFVIIGRTHIRCWMGTKKIIKNSINVVGEYKIKV